MLPSSYKTEKRTYHAWKHDVHGNGKWQKWTLILLTFPLILNKFSRKIRNKSLIHRKHYHFGVQTSRGRYQKTPKVRFLLFDVNVMLKLANDRATNAETGPPRLSLTMLQSIDWSISWRYYKLLLGLNNVRQQNIQTGRNTRKNEILI